MIILSVDDVILVRKMIRNVVESMGGTFLEASNGIEALDILEKYKGNIDLILLDWNMPQMNGWEFLNTVKNNINLKHIPVIMTTTENEKDKIIKAVQAGASNYLVKPFTDQELAKKIMASLGSAIQRFNRSLSAAMINSIGSAIRLQVLESNLDSQEQHFEEEYFFGQMLIFGEINAIVLLNMKKASGARLVSLTTGKSIPELNDQDLVDGITEFINAVSVNTITAMDANVNIFTPCVFVSLSRKSLFIMNREKTSKVIKKYRSGDVEVITKTHFI